MGFDVITIGIVMLLLNPQLQSRDLCEVFDRKLFTIICR